MSTPITTKIRKARAGLTAPKGMEISISPDGTGAPVPEYNQDPATPSCACKGNCKCSKY
tara:strand:+ start:408 stop:584 length:177 start_codon:yes stop_codon:yes gene_type:complete